MSRKNAGPVGRALDRVIPGISGVKLTTYRAARDAFGDALAGQSRSIWLAIGLTVSATVMSLATPWPLQVVLDRVLDPIAAGSASDATALYLAGAGLAAALLPILAAKLTYHATVVAAEIGKTATVRIRKKLFSHLNSLSLHFHSESRTGDLLVRLTGDVNLLRDMLFASWLNLLDRGLYFFGLSVALFVVDWRLGVLAIVPLPFLTRSVRTSTSELRSVVRSQRKREGSAAAFAGESLAQIRVLKALAAEDLASDRFSLDAGRSEKAGAKAARLAAGLQFSTQQVSAIGGALVLFGGAILVMLGDLTTGVLLVAVSYTKSLYKPLRKMSSEGGRLSKATAVTERVLEILELEPEPRGLGLPINAPLMGAISVSDVSYGYPGGNPVFSDMSFELPAGTFAVLSGPNGAGKSTLLSMLLRFIEPSGGLVRVDGRPVGHYQLHDYRRRIAYVPQSVLLFSGTVRENILLGNPDATDYDLARAVDLANLGPVIDRFHDGLETEIGERGETLSGGEARRVMLARAAVRHADIFLLDEPFEGIDAPSRPLVAQSIRAVSRGRTTLVVSHVNIDELSPDVVLTVTADGVRVQERSA